MISPKCEHERQFTNLEKEHEILEKRLPHLMNATMCQFAVSVATLALLLYIAVTTHSLVVDVTLMVPQVRESMDILNSICDAHHRDTSPVYSLFGAFCRPSN